MDSTSLVLQCFQAAAILAFGIVAGLQPRTSVTMDGAKHFYLLALFGVFRGGAELFVLWPASGMWTQALASAGAFIPLLEFARRVARDGRHDLGPVWSVVLSGWLYPAVAVIAAAAFAAGGWSDMVAALHFTLVFPAGLGGALALGSSFWWTDGKPFERAAASAMAIGLAAYSAGAALGAPAEVQLAAAITTTVALGALTHRAILRTVRRAQRSEQNLAELAASLSTGSPDETPSTEPGRFAQHLLDVTPAIILLLSADGRIEHVNRAFERLTGWKREELRGQEWFRLLPERDRDRISGLFRSAIQGAATKGNVNPIVTRSGEEREIEWYDEALRDERGLKTGLVAVGIDVTDRVRAERASRESETRLRTIIESEPECVKMVASDGRLLDMNPAGLRMIGAGSLHQAQSASLLELIAPGHRDAYAAGVASVFRGEKTEQQFELLALNGRRVWMEQHAVPMWDPADPTRVTAMLAVTRDITERRQVEEDLRRSESRLRQAQAIATIGNWELDLRTGRLWWSDEIFHIFDLDPASFQPSYDAFLDAIHPDDRDLVNAAYTSSVTTREPYQITHRLVMADGRIKHVEERCETDFAADGSAVRSRGTVQDITARVAVEQALRSSLREKEILLREVHHRVKNNLQIISSLLYFQAKKVKHPDDLAALEDARQRLRSMSLVHERLYRTNDLSAVEMASYLAALASAVQQSHEATRARVTITVACDSLRLPIDVAMPLGLLASELLTNALKHAFPHGRSGHVDLRLAAEHSRLSLIVSDSGCGMPSGQPPTDGTTFGWQLVAALTEQLGGKVSVRAERGTQVTIELPIDDKVVSRAAVLPLESPHRPAP